MRLSSHMGVVFLVNSDCSIVCSFQAGEDTFDPSFILTISV